MSDAVTLHIYVIITHYNMHYIILILIANLQMWRRRGAELIANNLKL
jgi:hypothetical protein